MTAGGMAGMLAIQMEIPKVAVMAMNSAAWWASKMAVSLVLRTAETSASKLVELMGMSLAA